MLVMPLAVLPTLHTAIRTLLNTYECGLFKNNHTPADTDDFADYTEANFSGYARLACDAWGVPFLDGDRSRTNHPILNFPHDGGGVNNDIYGYFVVTVGGDLVFAERNALAPVTVGPGVTYSVALTDTYRNDS